ncbi:MAG: RecQ family ATP-dependent DNA helicase [Bacteroidia bacterium]
MPNVDLLEVLHKYWGFSSLRPFQAQVIESLVGGRDVLALLPTGGGKSLCYQLPGVSRAGVTLVISPLIALMYDQVHSLLAKGIPSAFINSTLPQGEKEEILFRAQRGELKFLYVAPERLLMEDFLISLQKVNLSLVAVDEAHCVSGWGYDFRPAYLRIGELREHFPSVQMIALTATATEEVKRDIITYLRLRNPVVVRQSFYRSNFSYAVLYDSDKDARLMQVLQRLQGSGIIYVNRRASSVSLAERLRGKGFSVVAYHAGLSSQARKKIQEAWVSGKIRVVVATSAFGMGIDKPDVRFVIHYHVSVEPEAYFQEVGRAGRDGQKAYAIAFFSPKEAKEAAEKLQNRYPAPEIIEKVYHAVMDILGVPVGEVLTFPRVIDEVQVAKAVGVSPFITAYAMDWLHKMGLICVQREGETRAYLKSLLLPAQWHQIKDNPFTEWILRLGGAGFFSEGLYIDLRKWAYDLQMNVESLHQAFVSMREKGWIAYDSAIGGSWVHVMTPRMKRIPKHFLPMELWEKLKARLWERWRFMQGYYTDLGVCRAQKLMSYFSEEIQPCGKCDVCRGYHDPKKIFSEEKMHQAMQVFAQILRKPTLYHTALMQIEKHLPGKAALWMEYFISHQKVDQQGFYVRWQAR